MKNTMKKVTCLLLVAMMVFSLAACSGNSGSSANAEVEAYVKENGDALASSMITGMGAAAGEADCDVSVDGDDIVLDCSLGMLDSIPEENKAEAKATLQQTYDSMKSTFKTSLASLKDEVPSVGGVVINVCDTNGEVYATIDIDL